MLATYVHAISERDYQDAYGCLSAGTRAALPFETFVEHLGRDESLTRLRLRALGRRPATTAGDATVTIEGESIRFTLEEAGFRIVGNPADAFDQSTPRGAITAFTLALAERRAEWVLALAAPATRALLDLEAIRTTLADEHETLYAELADSLATSLDTPIEENGSHASMRVGVRRVLRLVKVEGSWYVDGID